MFICILGLLAVSLWSTSAFAQASLSVSSVPRTTAISTGHTEIAGDILINMPTNAGGFGAGSSTLTIDYGVPITVPASGFISVCGALDLAGGGPACAGGTSYLPNATGAAGTFQIGGTNQNQLLIVLPAIAAGNGAGSALSITGVKVSLAAFAGSILNATLAASAPAAGGPFTIASGQNVTTIINSVAPAFTTATASTAAPIAGGNPPQGLGRGTILTTATVSNRDFNIDIPENFVDAFKATLGVSGYLNDPALTFTFSGIPAGVFLNLAGGDATSAASNAACTSASTVTSLFYNTTTGVTTNIPVANLTNTLVSQANPTTSLSFAGLVFNQTQTEAIRLRGCIYTSGATAPLAAGTIAASITLSPNGTALNAGVQITPVAGNFPRYQVSTVSVNVVDIVAAETVMLISFAVRNTAGFDTGIAIANTSADPLGSQGVTPNDGTISLTFFPQGTGSSFTYTTTAGSPGQGLSATGALVAGKTWSVGLSELLPAISGAPTSFTGYVFIRANFTNAHGAAYVTNYAGFTSNTPFLIVPTGRSTTAEGLNN
jgi:hypothetical protein